jgi:hypothetical protein
VLAGVALKAAHHHRAAAAMFAVQHGLLPEEKTVTTSAL